jgi:hypothetical protein
LVVYEKVYQVTMADPVGAVGGIKKLNSSNYKYWRTRIESYLRGQGLWGVVAGNETTPPPADDVKALKNGI